MSLYPPTAFSFRVVIGAGGPDSDAAFQEVGGIGAEMETEPYHEGGENRFVHSLPKGVKHPKLTLKRGIADRDSPLVQWCKAVLEGGLSETITVRDVNVHLLDETGTDILRHWSFQNAYPSNWVVDPFQADKSAVAIEKIELTYAASTRMI
jgi:phage tail-like protein